MDVLEFRINQGNLTYHSLLPSIEYSISQTQTHYEKINSLFLT